MLRPRVKTIYPPFPVGNATIRIGGVDYGRAAEIRDDEQGHVWTLLELLDGTRTRAEIVAAMQARDPTLESADVEAVVDDLAAHGYLEDAAAEPAPGTFSQVELERYRRNVEFFAFYTRAPVTGHDVQAKLKASRVTVLGLGGMGAHLAMSLAATGVGDLLLVDFDTVELSNLNRQLLYTDEDVGSLKTEAAARRLRQINPHISVSHWDLRIDGVDAARRAMHGRDLLVCAADRPRIVLYDWLNEAALEERVPWIRGANDGLTVNLFLHVPYESACFECEQLHARRTYNWYDAYIRHAREHVGDRTVNPCTSPVAGLIGNLVAFEAIKRLTGVARPVILNHKLVIDLQTMETVVREGHPQPDCPRCGHAFVGVGRS